MRYFLKEKFFSFTESYIIKNEMEDDLYNIQAKLFVLGNKLSFRDTYDKELLFIAQKLLSLETTYNIYSDGILVAVIKKKLFNFINDIFEIEIINVDKYRVEGNFLEYEYQIFSEKEEIALISKQWITLTDTYTIDITPDHDDVLILACAVIIDLCCHACMIKIRNKPFKSCKKLSLKLN